MDLERGLRGAVRSEWRKNCRQDEKYKKRINEYIKTQIKEILVVDKNLVLKTCLEKHNF